MSDPKDMIDPDDLLPPGSDDQDPPGTDDDGTDDE